MVGGVEPHVSRSLRRLYAFGDVVLIWRVLMNHRERAVGIRGKRGAGGGIEASPVYASADRNRGHDFPGLVVGHSHHTAATSAEQAVMGGVDRHGDRLLARGGGPTSCDGRRLRIDLNHLTRVGEIRIHLA